ncbi:MAG: hypothetical protein JWR72_1099 [Flavisolibacter sp.]|nr:hypothetical protein [Flavisolibacter sp.]
MAKANPFFLCFPLIALLTGCSGKPSKKDISKKILQEYVCAETAKVENLKILKTERTESTGIPPVFRYTVRGEVAWSGGCSERGTKTTAGTKEKFEKLVILYKTEECNWE